MKNIYKNISTDLHYAHLIIKYLCSKKKPGYVFVDV